MNVKQQAIDIVEKMEEIVQPWESEKCSLVAVEKLIEFDKPRFKYWTEVKKEIEKRIE